MSNIDEPFVGIDYGVRRVAIACFGGRWTHPQQFGLQVEEMLLPQGDDILNAEALGEFVYEWVKWWRPVGVAIESPIQGASANIRTGLRLAGVAMVLAVNSSRAGSSVMMVEPSTWKKQVVGSGSADKAQVAEWLSQTHPELFSSCTSQDLVDATCLALHAKAVLGG